MLPDPYSFSSKSLIQKTKCGALISKVLFSKVFVKDSIKADLSSSSVTFQSSYILPSANSALPLEYWIVYTFPSIVKELGDKLFTNLTKDSAVFLFEKLADVIFSLNLDKMLALIFPSYGYSFPAASLIVKDHIKAEDL